MEPKSDWRSYNVDALRETEYPMLQGEVYLDHTGTTLYAQSALKTFVNEMSVNLLGNPHSDARSSQLSTRKVEAVRRRALEFLHADPEHFDLIFVLNATAAVKLVLEALRDFPASQIPTNTFRGPGLWYGYHRESHTSVVGGRELADGGQHCFLSDTEVESWLKAEPNKEDSNRCPGQTSKTFQIGLFAYPGQSNMTGRRLPLDWPGKLRTSEYAPHQRVLTLLDAAALASTASLDCLRDPEQAPDFTAVSFYKIFGFPDLGGLIVRKKSASVLLQRSYFGGGTVEMATCSELPWHSRKVTDTHEALEDGTVPFHNIIALGCALDTHAKLFISQEHVSQHTSRLTAQLFQLLSSLHHANGTKVCKFYQDPNVRYGDSKTQGSIIAFNVRSDDERWLRLAHVEEAANEHRIHLRTGAVCNPGGLVKALNLEEWELFRNYTAGVRCGCRNLLVGHKPSGIIRVSMGAMSTLGDVECFTRFIQGIAGAASFPPLEPLPLTSPSTLYLHTLMVYPIRACCAYLIPDRMPWQVASSGLRWDREWCLVDLESGSILDQKQAPRLLFIQPQIHVSSGMLRICVHRSLQNQPRLRDAVEIPLCDKAEKKASWAMCTRNVRNTTNDAIHQVQVYQSPDITSFFTAATGVLCTLARFESPASLLGPSERYSQTQLPEVIVSSQRSAIIDQPPRHEPVLELQAERRRSPPVALSETLRANVVAISDPVSGPKRYCLLRIEERETDCDWHYARMKAIEITAERQGPEVFKATSPVVKMIWMPSVEDDVYLMPRDGGMLPIHTGQIVRF